jgi:transmembrane sensor
MTNKVAPIQGGSVNDTACLWISKLDRGLSPSERAELDAWLDAAPDHGRVLLDLARCWDKTDALALLADVVPKAQRHAIKSPRSAKPWFWGGALAATAFAVFMFMSPSWLTLNKPYSPEALTYETAVGGLSRVILLDGSVLTLNTDTRVEVTLTDDIRLLTLRSGEMHIDVAKDPDRPLQVWVNDTVFEAVGTQFNIRIEDSQHVELLVTEGKVRVGVSPKALLDGGSAAATPILLDDLYLAQGERVIVEGKNRKVESLVPGDIEVELSWQNGNLVFRGEPLSEAITEISRYTSVEFVIVDEDLKALRVAGLFKSGDVAGFLNSLEANFAIRYERNGNQTFLRSPE